MDLEPPRHAAKSSESPSKPIAPELGGSEAMSNVRTARTKSSGAEASATAPFRPFGEANFSHTVAGPPNGRILASGGCKVTSFEGAYAVARALSARAGRPTCSRSTIGRYGAEQAGAPTARGRCRSTISAAGTHSIPIVRSRGSRSFPMQRRPPSGSGPPPFKTTKWAPRARPILRTWRSPSRSSPRSTSMTSSRPRPRSAPRSCFRRARRHRSTSIGCWHKRAPRRASRSTTFTRRRRWLPRSPPRSSPMSGSPWARAAGIPRSRLRAPRRIGCRRRRSFNPSRERPSDVGSDSSSRPFSALRLRRSPSPPSRRESRRPGRPRASR